MIQEQIGGGPIFVSPLRRAIETATPVAEMLSKKLEILEEFRELDMGDLEGTSGPAAVATYWEIIDAWAEKLGIAGWYQWVPYSAPK